MSLLAVQSSYSGRESTVLALIFMSTALLQVDLTTVTYHAAFVFIMTMQFLNDVVNDVESSQKAIITS